MNTLPLVKLWRFAILSAAFPLMPLSQLLAAPGDLDPSFGRGGAELTDSLNFGAVRTLFGSHGKASDKVTCADDNAAAVLLRSDGRILVVGNSQSYNQDTGWLYPVFVAQYLPDGSLDASFGSRGDGKVVLNLNQKAVASRAALQADGKVLILGGLPAASEAFLLRLNNDGSLDQTFGTSGILIFGEGIGADVPSPGATLLTQEIHLQPDGRILITNGTQLYRFETSGTLDSTFNGTGVVQTNQFGLCSLALQSDGKIIVGGPQGFPNFLGTRCTLFRFNPDGTLDTSFGTGGQLDMAETYALRALAVQADGKIVLTGMAQPGPNIDYSAYWKWDAFILRLTSDGQMDTSFGNSGSVTTDFENSSNDTVSSIAIQPDGKIVIAGSRAFSFFGPPHAFPADNRDAFALARYNADGTTDMTFGSGGKVIEPFAKPSYFTGPVKSAAFATDLALQPDGKIVVVGTFDDPESGTWEDFIVARFLVGDLPAGYTPYDAQLRFLSTDSTGKGPILKSRLAGKRNLEVLLKQGLGHTATLNLTNKGGFADSFKIRGRCMLPGLSTKFYFEKQDVTKLVMSGRLKTNRMPASGVFTLQVVLTSNQETIPSNRLLLRVKAVSDGDKRKTDETFVRAK
jgi:uncharacterized delta-60 repeat protein